MDVHAVPNINPQTLDNEVNDTDENKKVISTKGKGKLKVGPSDYHGEIEPDTIMDQQEAVKEEASSSYIDKAGDTTLDTLNRRQDNIIDNIDHEKMFKDYTTNFTWNNPRGNYNAKSYANTLALSREADARNNRLIRKPNNIGGYYLGGNSVQPTFNAYEKMPQIDTEEMRAMDASRNIDLGARRAQTDLQAKVQAYDYELQRMSDSQKMQLMYQIGFDEHKFNDAYRKMIADIGFKEYSENKMRFLFDRMRQQLALYMNQEVANTIMDAMLDGAGSYANLYAALFAPNPMPEATELMLMRAKDYLISNSKTSLNALESILGLYRVAGTVTNNNVATGFTQGASSAIGGLSNEARDPYDAND